MWFTEGYSDKRSHSSQTRLKKLDNYKHLNYLVAASERQKMNIEDEHPLLYGILPDSATKRNPTVLWLPSTEYNAALEL